MHMLTLVYKPGCPRYKSTVRFLESLNVDFQCICRKSKAEEDEFAGFTSPILLMGKTVVYSPSLDSETRVASAQEKSAIVQCINKVL